jgi:magnesium chelatase subunit I
MNPDIMLAQKPIVLPYCRIVGQHTLRRALEIAFVSPTVGGVLATGQRGTAKSTTVRAFARMAYGELPVTLPIGATDDRVLGGWQVEQLLDGKAVWQPGLVEDAGAGREPGILYIDEVNLLDDHLVNIILDVAATGILTVQRDGGDKKEISVRFSLVGTMNPEEGSLRPQLLDRFGLVVPVESAYEQAERREILQTVLRFEEESSDLKSEYMAEGYEADRLRREELKAAQGRLGTIEVPEPMVALAAKVAAEFKAEGHRGELVMVRAARALAAIENATRVEPQHLRTIAPLALMHRRATGEGGTVSSWSAEDDQRLAGLVPAAPVPTADPVAAR